MTFADLGTGPLGITCQHVIGCYRKMRESLENVVFQIGNVEVDPLIQLVDESDGADLATITLTPKQVEGITTEGAIGSCVFQPISWPPPGLKEGEYVAFGGFPSALKTIVSFDELVFRSWSNGASRISSVSDFKFVSAFNRGYWVKSFGLEHHMNLKTLGGMSGGPAFINRGLYWDLVGIVSDFNENYDAVIFASTSVLRADGTIESPPV